MKVALLRTMKVLLVLCAVVFLLMTCTYGSPPWTCADWTDEELRQKVADRLHESMTITDREYYAGFSHFEFDPGLSGSYRGMALFDYPRYWMIYVTMKGETRPDQELVAFLHCNGYIELSGLGSQQSYGQVGKVDLALTLRGHTGFCSIDAA